MKKKILFILNTYQFMSNSINKSFSINKNYKIFNNEDKDSAMFRVVIKSNVTRTLLNDLVAAFKESLEFLDEITEGGGKIDTRKLRNKNNRTITNHC